MTPGRRAPVGQEVVDVLVVGTGVAGTVASIEAAERGATVVALDHWGRGGASARSGGVVYAGGGTPQQRAAGFDDTAEAMERYLALEEGIPLDDARLERFCRRSLEDFGWLVAHGVTFPAGFDASKAVVPVDDDTGLYFSGNEKHFDDAVPAVARGHRVAGAGMTGRDLTESLHRAARRAGVDLRPGVVVERLLQEPDGRVVGVEALVLRSDTATRAARAVAYRSLDLAGAGLRHVPASLSGAVRRLERRRGRRVRILARRGVVLATGGFSYNRRLMAAHAPAFARAMPLGTPGDDGSGILMAQQAGAGLRLMEHCGASRFIAPPEAFCRGILVDADGERICDESLYAATLSARIADHGGRAWLVVDRAVRRQVRGQIRAATRLRTRPLGQLLSGKANHVVFPRLFGSINLFVNRRAAPDLGTLGRRCGLPPGRLQATVAAYNELASRGGPDPLGKAASLLQPLEQPPFSAVRCHLDGVLFPAPCITLGGIDVDGEQRARRPDGSVVPGLFAAGRCAAGVASRSYVSGLSLADCVFSGRNAGAALATAAAAAGAGASGHLTHR